MLLDEVLKSLPESDLKKKIMSEAVSFRIQNVADYVWADEKTYEGHMEECFSYRLPFPLVWFEFREPEIYHEGRMEIRIPIRPQCGALTTILNGRRFHLMFFIKYLSNESRVDCMGEISLSLDENYRALPGPFPVRASDEFMRYRHMIKAVSPERASDITLGMFPIITTAMNFLHCRNVSVTENHIPKKLMKANIKRGKERPYVEKYYTLEIEPMKRVLNAEGQAHLVGIKKAFHICRGHFKTYDDKPLFGRLRGTFWTPAHVKGSAERGIIRKDYEIKAVGNNHED